MEYILQLLAYNTYSPEALRGHLAMFVNTFIMNSIILVSLMYKLFYVVYCFNDFNGVTLY